MTPSEIFNIVHTHIPQTDEIPAPQLLAGAPAHEAKPYRDPFLYVRCPAEQWLALASFLKNNSQLSFDFLTFITAVDYIKAAPPASASRIDVVYHLYSLVHQHKCVVKVTLPRENPSIDSVVQLWAAADWQEREIYDMFGVRFNNHPNCTRILMWEGFPGWPMRKDYVHVPDRYDD